MNQMDVHSRHPLNAEPSSSVPLALANTTSSTPSCSSPHYHHEAHASDESHVSNEGHTVPHGSLVDCVITPVPVIFHRNHGEVPEEAVAAVDRGQTGRGGWQISVEAEGDSPRRRNWTVSELMAECTIVKEVIALQCAGNRRSLFTHTHSPVETEGIPWNESTIANVQWEGVRLSEVLYKSFSDLQAVLSSPHTEDVTPRFQGGGQAEAEAEAEAETETEAGDSDERQGEDGKAASNILGKGWHVILESVQDCGEEEGGLYGGSVPADIVLNPSFPLLLAFGQNDEPLTLEHGAPLRAVVPGFLGARSVKWLRRITLARHESQHYAQQGDYKIIESERSGITTTEATKDELSHHKAELMGSTEAMQWMPIQCSIEDARLEKVDKEDPTKVELVVKGYALGERGIPLQSIHLTCLKAHTKRRVPCRRFGASHTVTTGHIPEDDEIITHFAERNGDWFVFRVQYADRAEGPDVEQDADLTTASTSSSGNIAMRKHGMGEAGIASGRTQTTTESSSDTLRKRWDWVTWEVRIHLSPPPLHSSGELGPSEVDRETVQEQEPGQDIPRWCDELMRDEQNGGPQGKTWVVVAKAVDVLNHAQERWPTWNLRGVRFDGWSVRDIVTSE